MASRIALIECFRDTQICLRENPELARRTKIMQAGTRLYQERYEAVFRTEKQERPILVVADTTFHCASLLAEPGKTVAVLNFANAYNPGGSVREGILAQEECLCRSSNLYAALTMPYLLHNYYKLNDRTTGDMGTDRIIYSPGVTVFKSDDPCPVPLDVWFAADVITCAAPYCDTTKKKPVSLEKLEEVFFSRIRNILEVAIAGGVDDLVLGAFGCGAFHNPPELVAKVFRQLLVTEGYAACFRSVVFAIKPAEDNQNLEIFRKILTE